MIYVDLVQIIIFSTFRIWKKDTMNWDCNTLNMSFSYTNMSTLASCALGKNKEPNNFEETSIA